MTTNEKTIWPPESVRGMRELNREKFTRTISVPYVVVLNAKNLSLISKELRKYFLKIDQQFRPIQDFNNENDKKKIYLNPDGLKQCQEIIKKFGNERLLSEFDNLKRFIDYETIELGYENFNHLTIFRSIFGQDEDEASISGFSTVGHIIHVNLREHMLPYKKLIGQVLLDKIQGCRLVVNKIDIIENKYRNFSMEILAHADDDDKVTTIVDTIENNVRFRFDYANVYWNPRLSNERRLILQKLNPDVDYVYDVFAGVGPFSLAAAKLRKCHCLANDLNPESYRWLQENVRLNKMEKLVQCSNLDGRQFIRQVIKSHLIKQIETFDGSDVNRQHHVLMNLPAIAIEFLNEFNGLLSEIHSKNSFDYQIPFLRIHCYCFLKGSPLDPESLWSLASEHLGHKITDIEELHEVRKVAPNKFMFRLSFRIPRNVLYGSNDDDDVNNSNSNCKRQKIE